MAEYPEMPNETSSRIKKVSCELCKEPHYTKDCPQKEEGKTLEEAYYTQFGAPYQPGEQYRAAGPGFYQLNNGNSSYLARKETMEESFTLQERSGFGSLPSFTETNPKDQVKSIPTAIADLSEIRRMEASPYVVSVPQHRYLFPETVPFPRRLHNYCCDDLKEVHEVKILMFGVPAAIITDNETQLINDPFKYWAEGLGIKLVSTSGDHPHANRAVERANQSIMQGIKTRLHQEGGAWVEELPNLLWAHRTTPKTSNR
ncbi:ribonuclease H-like domain, reverse transcriptase, RNA-dependent DNA polymerase [Tanacetum coccineum]